MAPPQNPQHVRMPHNPDLLNLNVQDVIDDILNQEPDDPTEFAADTYIRNSSHQERIALGVMISEKTIHPRHLIEVITEVMISENTIHPTHLIEAITEVMISEKTIHPRHLIEAITEEVIHDTMDDVENKLDAGLPMREISHEDLMGINETRIYRNLLRMTIQEMANEFDQHEPPDQDHVHQEFLNVSMEMQEALDSAINESLADHRSELQDLKHRIFKDIRDRMASPNPHV